MNNIFEELMTGQSTLNESVYRKSSKIRKEAKKRIPSNKIKVESMKILEAEDYDELDDEFATVEAPEDVDNLEDGEVVLVIDPEASTEEEIPEDAAQDMVGDEIYKCPICGANYVCDCDATTEGLEVDENGVPVECPVCGDDAEQILIGEIAPIEGAGEEDTLDPVDVDDAEDEEDIEVDETDIDEEIPEEDEEEDVIEDSVKRRPRRRRSESTLRRPKRRVNEGKVCPDCGKEVCECDTTLKEDVDEVDIEAEDDLDLIDPIVDEPVAEPIEVEEKAEKKVEIDADNVYIDFDDTKFESLMNNFIKENYKNNARVKVTKGSYRKGTLTLEYVVRSGRKTLKKGTLKFEGYNAKNHKRTVSLKGRDKGAFTESFTRRPAFIVECVCVRNKVIPTALKYDFNKRVNESLYRVKGNVGKSGNFTKATHRRVAESKRRRRVNEGLTITRTDAEGDNRWNGPNEYNTGNISYTYWDNFWKSELSSLGKTLWKAEEFDDRTFQKFKDLITKYYNGTKKLKDNANYGPFVAEIYDVIEGCNSPEDIKIW